MLGRRSSVQSTPVNISATCLPSHPTNQPHHHPHTHHTPSSTQNRTTRSATSSAARRRRSTPSPPSSPSPPLSSSYRSSATASRCRRGCLCRGSSAGRHTGGWWGCLWRICTPGRRSMRWGLEVGVGGCGVGGVEASLFGRSIFELLSFANSTQNTPQHAENLIPYTTACIKRTHATTKGDVRIVGGSFLPGRLHAPDRVHLRHAAGADQQPVHAAAGDARAAGRKGGPRSFFGSQRPRRSISTLPEHGTLISTPFPPSHTHTDTH